MVLAKYPAWKANKRPASAVTQLDMQWALPLQQLQEALEQHLSSERRLPGACVQKSDSTWRGQSMRLGACIDTDSEGSHLCVCLVWCMPQGAVVKITFTAAIIAAGSRSAADTSYTVGPVTRVFSQGVKKLGAMDMVPLGALSSWSAAEANCVGWGWCMVTTAFT